MPAKFKPSEVVVNRVRGQRMSTHTPIKKYKHYYMKQTPKAEVEQKVFTKAVSMPAARKVEKKMAGRGR